MQDFGVAAVHEDYDDLTIQCLGLLLLLVAQQIRMASSVIRDPRYKKAASKRIGPVSALIRGGHARQLDEGTAKASASGSSIGKMASIGKLRNYGAILRRNSAQFSDAVLSSLQVTSPPTRLVFSCTSGDGLPPLPSPPPPALHPLLTSSLSSCTSALRSSSSRRSRSSSATIRTLRNSGAILRAIILRSVRPRNSGTRRTRRATCRSPTGPSRTC